MISIGAVTGERTKDGPVAASSDDPARAFFGPFFSSKAEPKLLAGLTYEPQDLRLLVGLARLNGHDAVRKVQEELQSKLGQRAELSIDAITRDADGEVEGFRVYAAGQKSYCQRETQWFQSLVYDKTFEFVTGFSDGEALN